MGELNLKISMRGGDYSVLESKAMMMIVKLNSHFSIILDVLKVKIKYSNATNSLPHMPHYTSNKNASVVNSD